MAEGKKLNLSIEKLTEIALALNENTIINKDRAKENKIPTDVFIKQFGINRKDFSETIKETEIKYNKSTHLYDIPGMLPGNNKVTNVDIKPVGADKQQSNNKVTTIGTDESNNEVTTVVTAESNYKVTPSNIKDMPKELVKVMAMSNEIEEMLSWYRRHKEDAKIIEVPEISLSHPDLEGEAVVRSFKTYKSVLDKFGEYCKSKKESQKDLLALALVEFMEKYR